MVSIIVPVYNTEKYLKPCIRSIQNQTVADMEIILVDDGSRDSSGEICDRFAWEDERIRVVHKVNGGLVSARKVGIQSASGDYVGFVDSDDWIEREMFQVMYQKAKEADADIVAEGYLEDIEGVCQSRRNVWKAGFYGTEKERTFLYRTMLNCDKGFCLGLQPFLWNKLIRRELAEESITRVDDSIRVGEDGAVIYPAFLEARRIVVLDDCHYHYCLRNGSMSWGHEREEKELSEVILLHTYLANRFSGSKERYALNEQLKSYTINNMLVRAFGRFAGSKEGEALFPFEGIRSGESVILYGAGALGRAVYKYIEKTGTVSVRAWVDQNAEAYKRMGLPVEMPGTIRDNGTEKILIAVQKKQAAKEIEKTLIGMGIEGSRLINGAFSEMWERIEGLICPWNFT